MRYIRRQGKRVLGVSLQDSTFLRYTLSDGKYLPLRTMAPGDVVTSAVLPGFSLDLPELFAETTQAPEPYHQTQ